MARESDKRMYVAGLNVESEPAGTVTALGSRGSGTPWIRTRRAALGGQRRSRTFLHRVADQKSRPTLLRRVERGRGRSFFIR